MPKLLPLFAVLFYPGWSQERRPKVSEVRAFIEPAPCGGREKFPSFTEQFLRSGKLKSLDPPHRIREPEGTASVISSNRSQSSKRQELPHLASLKASSCRLLSSQPGGTPELICDTGMYCREVVLAGWLQIYCAQIHSA